MTEITWQGKYDKNGKKKAPLRIALPFQTIETVNESAQERIRTLDLFAQGKPTDWRNRLIWGDKKYVLPALLPEFAGKINLIYIDPPFDTGADFSFTAKIPPHNPTEKANTTNFVKQPSIIEQKAYRDTWGKGLDSYLQWFYETALVLRELLAEDGSIFIHIDWRVNSYIRLILTAKQLAAENKVDLKFKKIPREVLDKRAVEQGDISFFELAALDVSAKIDKKAQRLTLTLNNFIIQPDDVPIDVMQTITHWSQWIDYWAVDFNYHDDTFHNEWQSYRTKKNPEMDLNVAHYYPQKGTYTVLVKVIDILGNDTTKLLDIKV